MRSFATLTLTALIASGAAAGPFAYVPNEGSGTISVVDTESDKLVGEIKAGSKPRGTAATRDGKRLYVSDQPNNRPIVIDLEARKETG